MWKILVSACLIISFSVVVTTVLMYENKVNDVEQSACNLIDHLITDAMNLSDTHPVFNDIQLTGGPPHGWKSADDNMKDAIAKVMADPSVKVAHLPIPGGASHYHPVIMKRRSFDGSITIVKKESLKECWAGAIAPPEQIPDYPSLKGMPGRYSIGGLDISVTFKEEDSYNEILEMCLKFLSLEYLSIIKD